MTVWPFLPYNIMSVNLFSQILHISDVYLGISKRMGATVMYLDPHHTADRRYGPFDPPGYIRDKEDLYNNDNISAYKLVGSFYLPLVDARRFNR